MRSRDHALDFLWLWILVVYFNFPVSLQCGYLRLQLYQYSGQTCRTCWGVRGPVSHALTLCDSPRQYMFVRVHGFTLKPAHFSVTSTKHLMLPFVLSWLDYCICIRWSPSPLAQQAPENSKSCGLHCIPQAEGFSGLGSSWDTSGLAVGFIREDFCQVMLCQHHTLTALILSAKTEFQAMAVEQAGELSFGCRPVCPAIP